MIIIVSLSTITYGNRLNFKSNKCHKYKSPEFARSFAFSNFAIPNFPGIILTTMFENNLSRDIGQILLLYSVFIGPSAGNFYARDFLRGTSGILIRIATAGYFIEIGTLGALNSAFGGSPSATTNITLAGSAIVFIGSIGWNIYSASTSAQKYNNKHELSIQPIYNNKSKNVGISLSITL